MLGAFLHDLRYLCKGHPDKGNHMSSFFLVKDLMRAAHAMPIGSKGVLF